MARTSTGLRAERQQIFTEVFNEVASGDTALFKRLLTEPDKVFGEKGVYVDAALFKQIMGIGSLTEAEVRKRMLQRANQTGSTGSGAGAVLRGPVLMQRRARGVEGSSGDTPDFQADDSGK